MVSKLRVKEATITPGIRASKKIQYRNEFLENPDDNEINSYFHTITHGFDNFEELKYKLLHAYLNRTKNIKTISSFFYNFK